MTSAVQTPGSGGDTSKPDAIVSRIAEADRRRKVRFRIIFIITWAILIGGLVAILAIGGAVDLEFLAKGPPWWRFILGEISVTTEGIAGVAIGPVRFIVTGAFATIIISLVAIVVAIGFALLGSVGRLSKSAPIYAVSTLYVSLVRGTPLLVQILFIWLALPQVWQGFGTVDALIMGTFALAFNYGAYMTEIFRAGIQAVPKGQREAAAALGMSERRIFLRVVLPQAFRIVIPAIGNEFVAMIKDSSLLAVIGVQELLWKARTVGSQNFKMLETLLLAALVYWALTIIFSYFQERLEQRMARSDR
ncbi:MAG: amino acid ABC transporter permease [Chloroflexota bacterium]|jgi:polar amino acid transport system permease protein